MSKANKFSHNYILKIVLGGLLIAIEIILERYLFIGTPITRYSPAFIARAITGSLFGPLWTALICVLADFIGATIIYGSSNIFLSITALLRGFLYGLFLKKKITLPRIIVLVLIEEIGCSLLVNSVILHFMYGSAWKGLFYTRLIQIAVMIPVEIIVIYLLSRTLLPILRKLINNLSVQAVDKVNSIVKPGSHLGLNRVEEFAKVLGNPEQKLKIIHVAGTNGKGSTSNMIASVLKAAGYKVGIFNSPYLKSAIEYFNINGKLISEDDFADFTDKLTKTVKDSLGNGLSEAPTEFEFYTCAAMKYFADCNCDFAVIECGMGGKEDATNYIPAPEVAVITNIGIDHEKFLGSTLTEIAGHKAGIIKKGSAVVYYPSEEEACKVIENKCAECEIKPAKADFSRIDSFGVFAGSMSTVVKYATTQNNNYEILINTPAVFQTRNAAVALEAIDALKNRGVIISDSAIKAGFESFSLPARFEIISNVPFIIADGGHNPQCIAAVKETLKLVAENKKFVILTGVMKDKDYSSMYDELDEFACEYVAVSTGTERSLSTAELADTLKKYGKEVHTADTPLEGVKLAKSLLKEDEGLLVIGTFYMMAEVRKELLK